MKSKIFISIITLLCSGIIGVFVVNAFWGIIPFEGLELLGFYLFEFGMVIISPFLFLDYLRYWPSHGESAIIIGLFSLALVLFISWIYLAFKAKKKWAVMVPIIIWTILGALGTYAALGMSV